MRLSHGGGRLAESLRTFNGAWQRAGEHWRDQRRDEFARQFTDELQSVCEEAARALRELADILEGTVRRCQ